METSLSAGPALNQIEGNRHNIFIECIPIFTFVFVTIAFNLISPFVSHDCNAILPTETTESQEEEEETSGKRQRTPQSPTVIYA